MSSSASATAVYNLNRKCDLYGRADARRAGICRLGMEESRLDRFARVLATTLVCDRVLSHMDVRLGMILNLVCLFGACEKTAGYLRRSMVSERAHCESEQI